MKSKHMRMRVNFSPKCPVCGAVGVSVDEDDAVYDCGAVYCAHNGKSKLVTYCPKDKVGLEKFNRWDSYIQAANKTLKGMNVDKEFDMAFGDFAGSMLNCEEFEAIILNLEDKEP